MAKPPATWRWDRVCPAFECINKSCTVWCCCVSMSTQNVDSEPVLMVDLHSAQVRGPIAVQRYLKVCGLAGRHAWQAYGTNCK